LDAAARRTDAPFGVDRWLGALGAWTLRLLGATWRLERSGSDPFSGPGDGPVLGALLHRDFLIAAWAFRDRGLHVGVSRSRDGDRIDAALGRLGYGASARGSSSRGGAAAQRGLIARLREGRSVAVVVDGPRGPAGEPKPGIVQLARHSGRAITPVRFEAAPAWRFGSWDRACLPLPFARVVCRFGEPLAVEGTANDGDSAGDARTRAALAAALGGRGADT
jgi:hypothetical protein